MFAIIEHQRHERESLLAQVNYPRTDVQKLKAALSNSAVKLLIGFRRAGKTTIAIEALRNTKFAYLNFEDYRLVEKWNTQLSQMALEAVYQGFQYLLLREVQLLPSWRECLEFLTEKGINVIVTSSNENILYDDVFAQHRLLLQVFPVLPLSLKEYNDWSGDIQYEEYLKSGGLPELFANRHKTGHYLRTLTDSILYRDVVEPYKIRNVGDINNVVNYLQSHLCEPMSFNDVANALNLASVGTTKKFMDYLHEPFLFYFLPRCDHKLNVMKNAPKKIFIVDNAFFSDQYFGDELLPQRMLENLVFIELMRRGKDAGKNLFHYKSRNEKFADFVVTNGRKPVELVCVCYKIQDQVQERRLASSIIECAEELRCSKMTVVTFKDQYTIERRGYKIDVLPFDKF